METKPLALTRAALVVVIFLSIKSFVFAQFSTTGGLSTNTLTTGGQVGIGTSSFSPGAIVDIRGQLNIGTSATPHRLSLGGSGASYGAIGFGFSFTPTTNLYKYAVTNYASQINFREGGFDFLTAERGTMGNNISFLNAMRIQPNGNVGIGTSTPLANLHIIGNTHGGQIQFQHNNTSSRMGIRAYNDGTTEKMLFYTDVNNSHFPLTITKDGRVGIATASPVDVLTVNGTIRAPKIRVMTDITIPDYVFEDSYYLSPLSEVESYIQANKHLPEVPSAQEIKANGIDVAAMDAILLKKIEELTLYIIQQEKQNEALKKTFNNLLKENQDLKQRVIIIEKNNHE